MKYRYCFLSFLFCSLQPSAKNISPKKLANESMMGSVNLKNRSFSNLTINGSAKLSKIIVENVLEVYGSSSINESTLFQVKINGSVTIEKTTIQSSSIIKGFGEINDSKLQKLLSIEGSLSANKSIFNGIEASSIKIDLKNSRVENSILIKKTANSTCKQEIILDNTIIESDIIFESKNGIVTLKNNAQIKGKVTGGIIK